MYESYLIADPFQSMVSIVALVVGFLLFLHVTTERKSKIYRRVLADLFVAGRIRQIAKSKDIDLGQEFEDWKSFSKKASINRESFDEFVESDLRDEIFEDTFEDESQDAQDIVDKAE